MPTHEAELDTTKLLVNLVGIISSTNALGTQFGRLAREVGVAPGPSTIVFLTGLKKILRELPDKAFIDKNARFALVDAVQDALDEAIEAEEDAEDNQNNEQERR